MHWNSGRWSHLESESLAHFHTLTPGHPVENTPAVTKWDLVLHCFAQVIIWNYAQLFVIEIWHIVENTCTSLSFLWLWIKLIMVSCTTWKCLSNLPGPNQRSAEIIHDTVATECTQNTPNTVYIQVEKSLTSKKELSWKMEDHFTKEKIALTKFCGCMNGLHKFSSLATQNIHFLSQYDQNCCLQNKLLIQSDYMQCELHRKNAAYATHSRLTLAHPHCALFWCLYSFSSPMPHSSFPGEEPSVPLLLGKVRWVEYMQEIGWLSWE